MAQAQGSREMALEARLLEQLQAEWAIATDWTVRCLMNQGILIVLVQHPLVAQLSLVDPRPIFAIIESAFHREASIREWAAQAAGLYAVRIYIRQQGQPEPYGFYRFTWEDSALQAGSLVLARTSPVAPVQPSPVGVVENQPTQDRPGSTPVGAAQSPKPLSDSHPATPEPIPLQPTPVGQTAAPPSSPPQAAQAEVLEAEITAQPPKRWGTNLSYALAAGVAAALLLVGGGGYALSRPCVVGRCEVLAIARQMQATAMGQATPGQSAETVLEAYDAMMEASYLLDRIPSWSPHYTEAQDILAELTQESQKLERVVQAQRLAMAAAVQSQNPPHPITTWREIKQNWQAAIAQLEQVPQNSPVYPLAQRKLTEYRANLGQIDQRILKEIEAQEWVDLARESAESAETRQDIVTSIPGLQQVRQNWQSVINALQRVPNGTMAYAEAQQLLALYRPRLELAEEQLRQEQASMQRYNQAQSLASAAQSAERQNSWSQAVGQWEQALAEVRQIPEGTVSFERVQPLVNSYETALQQAQMNLEFQDTLTDLERLCSGSPRRCLLSRRDGQMRVTFTHAYEQFLATASASAPLSQLDPMLEAIAHVSDRTRIPIAVHEANGTLIGVYDPDSSRYVPRLN